MKLSNEIEHENSRLIFTFNYEYNNIYKDYNFMDIYQCIKNTTNNINTSNIKYLKISLIQSSPILNLTDIPPIEPDEKDCILNLNNIDFWPELEYIDLFANQIIGSFPNLPNLRSLFMLEDGYEHEDAMILSKMNIPDSIVKLEIYNHYNIVTFDFTWPSKLETLIISCYVWNRNIPSTIKTLVLHNQGDVGEFGIPQNYKFPSHIETLHVYSFGKYISTYEPNWPENVKELCLVIYDKKCPFKLENLPTSLEKLIIDCNEIYLNNSSNLNILKTTKSILIGSFNKQNVKIVDSDDYMLSW